MNYILKDIRNTVIDLEQEDKQVKCVWVKAHCGVIHNEKVDILAKELLQSNQTVNYPLSLEDLLLILKNKCIAKWMVKYRDSNKGLFCKEIKPTLTSASWFGGLSLLKDLIRTISRIRFNHTLVPFYLCKINIIDSPSCKYGEHGTVEYKILGCELNWGIIDQFMNKISKYKSLERPINLYELITSNKIKTEKMNVWFSIDNFSLVPRVYPHVIYFTFYPLPVLCVVKPLRKAP